MYAAVAFCRQTARFQAAAFGVIMIVVAGTAVAQASCPAPKAGQPLPAEATAHAPDNPPTWRARVDESQRELAKADLSRIRLLFLGDSITEQWDNAVFDSHFGEMGALRMGVGGDTTQGLLWRLPYMRLGVSLRPALIVLLIGTNNIYPGGNAEAVAIGIGEVVKSIRKFSPTSRILLLGLLPRGAVPDDLWRQMGSQINRLIAACADDRTIFYADPGRILAKPNSGVSPDIESDYLHPTPMGYRIVSDALDEEIKRLLE